MLYSLSGSVAKLDGMAVTLDVQGVGYLLTVPAPVWETLENGRSATLIVYTYVREDRLDLFGFLTKNDRALFVELLNISGIGPKTALELCSIPREMLFEAALLDDAERLKKVKGIGKKTAEKLIVDLKQLLEKHPEWMLSPSSSGKTSAASHDDDAIGALTSLGYERSAVLDALKKIPTKITKTEDRVAAVLRSL